MEGIGESRRLSLRMDRGRAVELDPEKHPHLEHRTGFVISKSRFQMGSYFPRHRSLAIVVQERTNPDIAEHELSSTHLLATGYLGQLAGTTGCVAFALPRAHLQKCSILKLITIEVLSACVMVFNQPLLEHCYADWHR